MKRRSFGLSVLTAAVFALSVGSIAFAANGSATVWVDNDGHAGPNGCRGHASAFTSIQTAVDASDANDAVKVCPGVYVGSVWIFGSQHNGLTLTSVREGGATVQARDGD